MQYTRIAALAILALSCARAQSGHWEGGLQAPNGEIKIIVDLTKSTAGEWTGAMAAPEQTMKDIPLAEIAVRESKVKFTAKTPRGDFIFDGSTSTDGKTLSGTFSGEGQEMPCQLTQNGGAKHAAASRSTAISKDLEGDWEGVLNVNGRAIHLKAHLANGPGGATGSVIAVEEGRNSMVFSSITQKESMLKLELAAMNGAYTGEVSADRRQIVGGYTQAQGTDPLVFTRPAK